MLFRLGHDRVRFLGDTGVVCSGRLTYLDPAWCLVRIALKLIRFGKPAFIVLKSGAVTTETGRLLFQRRAKQLPLSTNVFELSPRGLQLTLNR